MVKKWLLTEPGEVGCLLQGGSAANRHPAAQMAQGRLAGGHYISRIEPVAARQHSGLI